MPSSSLRGSVGPPKATTVDLYCTGCDSQIGTYQNEWIRLTSSYIIPKTLNGTKFGINVADEQRTVDGKDATALHACDVSEATCSKCSRAVGHFCRNAPGKPHLWGQYIFKLSKTHLKRAQTCVKVGFIFTFGAIQSQQDRARSMFTAPLRPPQSPSPFMHGARTQEARQSMGPPSSRPNNGLIIDPALTAPAPTSLNSPENITHSAESISEAKVVAREGALILRKLEEQDKKLTRMSESLDDWKIQNGRLLAALMRSSPRAPDQQDTSDALETLMDDFESMVNAAYEARSGNNELEVLRAENESMKAKLQTIASAMGSANVTPGSQPLKSPMAAFNTLSLLGKRKRIESGTRHSLLQNEVSFTDEDDLNEQSELFSASHTSSLSVTPARQFEKTSNISSGQPGADSAAAVLSEPATQVASPPDSSLAEPQGRESRSAESDGSLEVDHECSGNTAPEIIESIRDSNVDYGLADNTYAPEPVGRQVAGTTTVENVAGDSPEASPWLSPPQRAHKPTPKIADNHQAGRTLPAKEDTVGLQLRETRARTANALRRRTTSILLEGADGDLERDEAYRETEQRRKTTNAIPEKVKVDAQDGGESSRLKIPQRISGATPWVEPERWAGNANGYSEAYEDIPEAVAEGDLGHDTSLMTMTDDDDDDEEELFEQQQNDQHEVKMNGIKEDSHRFIFAQFPKSVQARQPSMNNRDPNRPKRRRRRPEEILRKYQCLFPGCTKAYGELPHLNTHVEDSSHGARWTKADYLEACRRRNAVISMNGPVGTQDGLVRTSLDPNNGVDVARVAEERNAEDSLAAPKRNQQRVDELDKIRQRDQMAKKAMEREEMMELMNGV